MNSGDDGSQTNDSEQETEVACTKPCTTAQVSPTSKTAITYKSGVAMCPCEDNPKTKWFVDKDNDNYSSEIIERDAFAPQVYPYKLAVLGPDCDDKNINVQKLNKCGVCAVEPVSGDCGDCNSFNEIIKKVLKTEGGFVNDPTDPGGATNKGVAWKTWEAYAKSVLGKDPTLDNLRALTTNDANKIYKTMYWDKIRADEIVDGDIRFLLFDFYVNAPVSSIETIQRTLNSLGESITVDGGFGTNTLEAINKYSNDIRLYNNFKNDRLSFYDLKVNESVNKYLIKKPLATEADLLKYTKKKYENGWKNRVNEFKNKTNENKTNVNCE
ncbi:hypothetical protein B6A10_16130 [Flavobacterium sp. L1I52]|uniref:Peptidoglycan binding domain-containing protein n=1 Tax=Flavobacterium pokkalii TaxID=1940408 RepID=A0ABR7UV68_9FLAO|nr:glycosyl hydrolase 108 family protein [Flavobacterium pokkalii]MBD0726700.1 hypothetical protein [Flavobacterium pokkalii]